jgi:hypothetical protein
MKRYTGQLERLKQRWLALGGKHQLSEADWDLLLDEISRD